MHLTDSAHARIVDEGDGPLVRVYPHTYGDHAYQVDAIPGARWVTIATAPGWLDIEVSADEDRPDVACPDYAHTVVTLPVQ